MKKFLTILIIVIYFTVNGQTNVSGGIYSNTTWSLLGSPYIITDTVVVFPGVILTIQPGVTVKFNSGKQLEIRQASIIALGTSNDSITFTSNAVLSAGGWSSINLNGGTMTPKFNYCVFKYASTAIADNRNGVNDTLLIKNSTFNFNTVGLNGMGTSYGIIDSSSFINNISYGAANVTYSKVNYCNFLHSATGISGTFNILNNCTINYNSTGFSNNKGNTMNSCTVNYNQTGINCGRACYIDSCIVNYNQSGIVTGTSISDEGLTVKNTTINNNAVVGISISNRGDSVYSCTIANNAVGLIDNNGDNTYPTNITKNGIVNNGIGLQLGGTPDNIYCNKICSNTTYNVKYGGVNNISLAGNYWCTADSASTEPGIYDGYDNTSYGLVKFMPINASCNSSTGIYSVETQNLLFKTYPNPATNYLIVELPEGVLKAGIKVFNLLGELAYSSTTMQQKTEIDISSLANGIYIIETAAEGNTGKQKFSKQ